VCISKLHCNVRHVRTYRDEVSDMALQQTKPNESSCNGDQIRTRSVTLRCCSNSNLANCRMSFRAPSSGMFAVLRTISLHRASARCRCINCETISSCIIRSKVNVGEAYVVETNGTLSSGSQSGWWPGCYCSILAQHSRVLFRERQYHRDSAVGEWNYGQR
jgi:hypothetical protein